METLIKASYLIQKKFNEFRVGISGDGPEMEKLVNLAEKLNLKRNVEFLGYRENVETYFNKTKVSVICSEREGLPFTAVESLACCTPVITTRCGDIVDILKDDVNGFFIEHHDDYKKLAIKCSKLLSDDNLLKEMSRNASKINLRRMEKDNIKVWKRVLSETK